MNTLEIVRGTSGKIKKATIDGQPIYAQTLIVEDAVHGSSKVTIIMEAIVKGHIE